MNDVTANSSATGPLASRLDRWLALLAVAAAVAYALLDVRAPAHVILKTSMCTLLALMAWRRGRNLLAVALLFSACGDALLAIDGNRLFVPGLASFLITQLLYAAIFLTGARLRPAAPAIWRKIAAAVIPLFAVTYAVLLWPKLGALAFPVLLYIAAIVAMAMLSLRVTAPAVALGAMMFMTSDSLISLQKFLWQAVWLGPAIWLTYAAAQLLITHGLLTSPSLPDSVDHRARDHSGPGQAAHVARRPGA